MPPDYKHDYKVFPYRYESRLICFRCERHSIHSLGAPGILWCDVCGVTSCDFGNHWSLVPADREEHRDAE